MRRFSFIQIKGFVIMEPPGTSLWPTAPVVLERNGPQVVRAVRVGLVWLVVGFGWLVVGFGWMVAGFGWLGWWGGWLVVFGGG
jgi:hypothetical protein